MQDPNTLLYFLTSLGAPWVLLMMRKFFNLLPKLGKLNLEIGSKWYPLIIRDLQYKFFDFFP